MVYPSSVSLARAEENETHMFAYTTSTSSSTPERFPPLLFRLAYPERPSDVGSALKV